MGKSIPRISIEQILSTASELPYCKIDREEFLSKELKQRVLPEQLADALENGTINAKIPMNILDEISRGSIALETTKVTLISTAAGIPGGIAMLGTVPTDLAQFYAHVFRIAQKLAYIYGSKEIEWGDGAQNMLILYLGSMFGVKAATAGLAKLAAANAAKIGARIATKPLTKYTLFNISKKILAWIGVKLTKDTVGKAVTKAIPIVSGFLSGGLSIATYLPMAKKLQRELSRLAAMSPEDLAEATIEADIVLEEYTVLSEEETKR